MTLYQNMHGWKQTEICLLLIFRNHNGKQNWSTVARCWSKIGCQWCLLWEKSINQECWLTYLYRYRLRISGNLVWRNAFDLNLSISSALSSSYLKQATICSALANGNIWHLYIRGLKNIWSSYIHDHLCHTCNTYSALCAIHNYVEHVYYTCIGYTCITPVFLYMCRIYMSVYYTCM